MVGAIDSEVAGLEVLFEQEAACVRCRRIGLEVLAGEAAAVDGDHTVVLQPSNLLE